MLLVVYINYDVLIKKTGNLKSDCFFKPLNFVFDNGSISRDIHFCDVLARKIAAKA